MKTIVASAAVLALVASVGVARATDIGVAARKLKIVDTTTANGKGKVTFVAKDAAITKGPGTDPALIESQLEVHYGASTGVYLAPQGSDWLLNKEKVAKYLNRTAPTGGATKVTQIKPQKLLKLVSKSLGDTPIDISTSPSGDVVTVYTVTNDGETNRHCSAFSICTYKLIAQGTGYKLGCKNGLPVACPPIPTTTTTSTSVTTSTSSSTSSTTSTSTSTSSTSSTSTSTSSSTSTSTSTTSSTSTSSSTTTSTSSSTTTTAPPVTGPWYPIAAGTVDVALSGAPSPGDSGGTTVSFTNFTPDTSWSQLYWGPDSTALPTAGLDASPHALTFSGIAGTTATWAGTTSWTDPFDSTVYPNVPIELRITVSGLGGTPWVVSTSIPGLDPGPGTDIGAVVDNSASWLDFDATVEFLADIPTDGAGNFIALNTVQVSGGQTNSSLTSAFYVAAP